MTYMAGSIGLLVTDRNTWHSRADQAWGATRVWNSGSSFETDSSTWHSRADQAWGASRVWNSGSSFETDSATWHSRADSAWGTSRVWNSGESWEAAYNRVLPPAAPGDHLSASGTFNRNATVWQPGPSLTLDRTGYWVIVAGSNCIDPTNGNNDHNGLQLLIGGSLVYSGGTDIPSNQNNWSPWGGMRASAPVQYGSWNSGTVITTNGQAGDNNNNARNSTIYLDAFFCSTQTYPH